MTDDWRFVDARNAISFTTKFVLEGSPILRVYHDYEGGWQFHGAPDQPATPEVGKLVCLSNMIDMDTSLAALHDLPWGWRATRDSVDAPRVRKKNHPFPTFKENGFYLEDAEWISEFLEDVNPPPEEVRQNLPVGAYAKLLFRFAEEMADRLDCQVERMWVRVAERDDHENYVGILRNDPIHDQVLRWGDTVHFHPLHIMKVEAEDAF